MNATIIDSKINATKNHKQKVCTIEKPAIYNQSEIWPYGVVLQYSVRRVTYLAPQKLVLVPKEMPPRFTVSFWLAYKKHNITGQPRRAEKCAHF
jgi:hypothetical protein